MKHIPAGAFRTAPLKKAVPAAGKGTGKRSSGGYNATAAPGTSAAPAASMEALAKTVADDALVERCVETAANTADPIGTRELRVAVVDNPSIAEKVVEAAGPQESAETLGVSARMTPSVAESVSTEVVDEIVAFAVACPKGAYTHEKDDVSTTACPSAVETFIAEVVEEIVASASPKATQTHREQVFSPSATPSVAERVVAEVVDESLVAASPETSQPHSNGHSAVASL